MVPDYINDSRLLIALDIDVVIGVLDANLLVPENQREAPVAAIPAG